MHVVTLKRLIFSILPLFCIAANTDKLYFNIEYLTIQEGLPHTDANVVIQDKDGIIWIGTYAGLCKYDGYQIETFYQEQENFSNSYVNRILDISIDEEGKFWLATVAGIQCFDPATKEFMPLTIYAKDSQHAVNKNIEKILSVKDSYVLIKDADNQFYMYERVSKNMLREINIDINARCYSMQKDKQNRVWLSTDQGCFIFDSGRVINQLELSNAILSDEGKVIRYTFLDSHNQLFIATEKNLYVSNSLQFINSKNSEGSIYKLNKLKKLPVSFENGLITDIVEDFKNNYWVSTTKGLFLLTPEKGELNVASFYAGKAPNSINSDFIIDLFIDQAHNLFISTYAGGVNIIDLQQKAFYRVKHDPDNPNTISDKIVRAIADDGTCIWVGTHSNGLNRINKNSKQIIRYFHDESDKSLSCNNIRSLFLNQDLLWIGHTNGLDVLNIKDSNPEILSLNDICNFPDDEVTCIGKDCFGQIWAGTWNHGVIRIIQKNNRFECTIFKESQPATSAFTPKRVISLYADEIYPEVFYSSGEQLVRLMLNEEGQIKHTIQYQADENNQNTLNSNFISTIRRQNDSVLWLGTLGGGVNRMVLLNGSKYKATSLKTGDSHYQNIECLEIDHDNNIWAGGNRLYRYNPSTEQLQDYKIPGGMNSYKIGSSYIASDGTIYMGGIDGFIYFKPADIKNNRALAHANISYVEVNNQKRIFVGRIELKYSENNVKIFLTPSHYSSPSDCKFRYRLVKYGTDWTETASGVHSISYANLPYGKYILQLMATNNDGIWSPEVFSIPLIVTPPWWLSNTAKFIYILFIIMLLTAIFFYVSYWIELKKKLVLKEAEKRQSKMLQLHQNQFFTNVSHELRTPLTLIHGTIEKMIREKEWREEYGNILTRNTGRMMQLIDNIIHFDKIKEEFNPLKVKEVSVHSLFDYLSQDFKNLADVKQVIFNLDLKSADRDAMGWLDEEYITEIYFNLLSNAFKYTPAHGEINVKVTLGKDTFTHKYSEQYTLSSKNEGYDHNLEIYIEDSGLGIPKKSLGKIFQRHYQVEENSESSIISSGIGLALVKKLVLSHKGTLSVSSETGKGTDYIIKIPYSKEYYYYHEVIDKCQSDENQDIIEDYRVQPQEMNITVDELKPVLLIVEDNLEVRLFLKQTLCQTYHTIEAVDGFDALEKIRLQRPDVILSDLMMPKMNGYELCKALKQNKDFAHIPFILLTAKVALEAKIEGVNVGADAYLEKPVNADLLFSTISNLFKSKNNVKKYLSSNYLSVAMGDRLHNRDNEFYNEIIKLIETNIDNPDLNVDFFCKELGYSRTGLYQKFDDVTGMPIKQFVRTVRLKVAVKIIAEEDIAISELILRIGIKSQSYFTNIFKREYGIPPSEYMKKLKNNNS